MKAPPQLIIVGGANGTGKTTFARQYAESVALSYLGADDIALQLSPSNTASVRIAAGREFSHRLSDALKARQSLVIESTLSGGSLARTIAKAREDGYQITIVFVFLDSETLCLHRIAERVQQGGHNVPEEDVRRRFGRVFSVFWNHYRPLADRCVLVYNGGESFLIIAEKENNEWQILDGQMWEKFNYFLEVTHETNKDERWTVQIARIGNKAVREAQARNRELGIVNWYSLNGQLVSDAAAPEPSENDHSRFKSLL